MLGIFSHLKGEVKQVAESMIFNQEHLMFQVNRQGNFQFINQPFQNLLGFQHADIIGHHVQCFIHPKDLSNFKEITIQLLQGKTVSNKILRIRNIQKEYMQIKACLSPIFDPNQEIVGFFGDATIWSQYLDQIIPYLEKWEKLILIFENINNQDIIGINITQNGHTIFQNQATTKITGYSAPDRAQWGPDENLQIIHPEDRPWVVRSMLEDQKEPVAGHLRRYEYRIMTKSGEIKWVEDYTRKILYQEEVAWLTLLIDVTARHHHQEQKYSNHYSQSMTLLTKGIAHDLNDFLSIILGNNSMIQTDFTTGNSNIAEYTNEIGHACKQATNLSRQLLEFANELLPSMEKIQLKSNITAAVDVFSEDHPMDIQVKVADDLWPIHADRAQMTHIFENILSSLAETHPNSAQLSIVAENYPMEQVQFSSHLQTLRDYVKISFHNFEHIPKKSTDLTAESTEIGNNTGLDLDTGNFQKISDPSHITSLDGSRLGLSLSFMYIINHEGEILVNTKKKQGAVFTIFLPK